MSSAGVCLTARAIKIVLRSGSDLAIVISLLGEDPGIVVCTLGGSSDPISPVTWTKLSQLQWILNNHSLFSWLCYILCSSLIHPWSYKCSMIHLSFSMLPGQFFLSIYRGKTGSELDAFSNVNKAYVIKVFFSKFFLKRIKCNTSKIVFPVEEWKFSNKSHLCEFWLI